MARKRRKPMAEINVVPYIDVMMVLLVIFMISTPLLTQGVKVDLPQANETESLDPKPSETVIVKVDLEGQLYLTIDQNYQFWLPVIKKFAMSLSWMYWHC